MKILLVAGARPNFIKISSIFTAINIHNQSTDQPIYYLLVHTGQHYDEYMSQTFFKDLALPQPHIDLEVGSSFHVHQTAEVMKRFEPVLLKEWPDIVVVVDEVNSTVACSVVASKITYPHVHVLSPLPMGTNVLAGTKKRGDNLPRFQQTQQIRAT